MFTRNVAKNFGMMNTGARRAFSSTNMQAGQSNAALWAGAGILAASGLYYMNQKEATPAMTAADYPPHGLHEHVKTLPKWIQVGCGDSEYICAEKGATFSGDNTPQKMPDLSGHNNFMTDVLKKDPAIYDRLKNVKTKSGVTLGQCIKTGMDNKGHPFIKTCGIVAGDEESWTTFREIFDPIISDRHNGYAPDAKHPTDMNPDNLSTTPIDPTGRYVLTSRCRTGRSIRGFKLPPCISF